MKYKLYKNSNNANVKIRVLENRGIKDVNRYLNLSDSEIIIADKSKVISLFGDTDCLENSKYAHLYRLLPCNTVSGYSSLEGFRCEKALVECGSKKITLKKPILAVSKVPLKEDYNAIINPKILR